jgi:hypothetical protein
MKIVSNIFFCNKITTGEIGLYFENNEKIAKLCNKSEISKQNVKTMRSLLIFHLWETLDVKRSRITEYDPL